MSVQSIVRFFIEYNQLIIEWTFIAILLLLGSWVGLRALAKKQQKTEVSVESKEMGDSMDFSKARFVMKTQSSASPETSTPSDTLESFNAAQHLVKGPTDLEPDKELMKKFSERGDKIEKLESLLKNYKSIDQQGDSEVTLARLKELKELQEKLDGYEVIEDDIVDLSQYKNENAQLKKQLKALKLNDDKTDLAQKADDLLKQG